MKRIKLLALAVAGVILPVALVFSAYLIASGSIGVAGTVPPVPHHRVTDQSAPSPSPSEDSPRSGRSSGSEDRSGSGRSEDAEDPDNSGSGSDNSGTGSGDDSSNSGPGGGGSDNSGKGSGDD
jgi:hypothetical protein